MPDMDNLPVARVRELRDEFAAEVFGCIQDLLEQYEQRHGLRIAGIDVQMQFDQQSENTDTGYRLESVTAELDTDL